MHIGPVFSVLAVAAAAATAGPLGDLNALRAEHGIPAGIVENTAWTAGCAAHMRYLELNRFAGDWHTESPWRPGYTPHGAATGAGAVLSNAPEVGVDPDWEQSLYHFAQLLAPKLSVSGATDGCIVTVPGYQRPEPPVLQVYTYPGNGTSTATSPYLFVLPFGAGTTGARVSDASLTGPAGPVPVSVIDNFTPSAYGLLPPGGVLVPGQPLVAGELYTAQATVTTNAGRRATTRWSFRPAPGGAPREDPPQQAETPFEPTRSTPARTPAVSLNLAARGRGARATLRARGSAVGRRARVKIQRLGCRCKARTTTLKLTKAARRLTASRRPVKVTVTLNGFFKGDTAFRGLTLVRSLS